MAHCRSLDDTDGSGRDIKLLKHTDGIQNVLMDRSYVCI